LRIGFERRSGGLKQACCFLCAINRCWSNGTSIFLVRAPMQSHTADLVIAGGGAAGLAAAIFAAETAEENGPPGLRIVVLDGAKTLGAKFLVSGGGRCNVTHHEVVPRDFNGSQNIVRHVLSKFDVAGDRSLVRIARCRT
jgi:predicted flavoprotein YhiN